MQRDTSAAGKYQVFSEVVGGALGVREPPRERFVQSLLPRHDCTFRTRQSTLRGWHASRTTQLAVTAERHGRDGVMAVL